MVRVLAVLVVLTLSLVVYAVHVPTLRRRLRRLPHKRRRP